MSHKIDRSQEYLQLLQSVDEIEHLIIGQDPYPNGPNGIAFCKETWDEFFEEHCSGWLVYKSFGMEDKHQAKLSEAYPSPVEHFTKLLEAGKIALVNVCHDYIQKYEDREQRLVLNLPLAEEALAYNMQFVRKAKKIIVLGWGLPKNIWLELYSEHDSKCVLNPLHPSLNNNGNERYEEQWGEGTKYLYDKGIRI